MRRLLFVAVFFCFAGVVLGNPVDINTARKAATIFVQLMQQGKDIAEIKAVNFSSEYYVFNIGDNNGFVMLSSDDNTEPILAYSDKGNFDPANVPPHVSVWLRSYEYEIAYNRSEAGNGRKNNIARNQWQELLSGHYNVAQGKAAVDPMLQTTWNQSPYYNDLCPYDSANNGRAVCGCTATATSQIMKYFNYPETGYGDCTWNHRLGDLYADYGSTTYQWDSMPEYLSASSTPGQVNAVATIIYHIGVAVSMDYSALGSGGKTCAYGYGGDAASENAFKYNFKYSPYVWSAFRIDYDLAEWKNLMKNELNNGRPILYAGYDEYQGGHAFVLDGYNAAGLFHINWGWGGMYDGFYRLGELTPNSTSYNFNLFATATIGIEPYEHFGEATTTVNTSTEGINGATSTDGIVTGAGQYNFGDTIVLTAIPTNDYSKFVQWSDGCKYNPRSTVATGGEISFTAQFAPLRNEVMRYYTCENAMNRAANIPEGLGKDSVWGIRIPEYCLWNGDRLTAVRFMGYKEGTITLSILQGTDSPTDLIYSATFHDSLDYPYTFHTHQLPSPLTIDSQKSLWIKMKCTDVDTCGVFSIWSGNTNSMLAGENLEPRDSKFSWMIEGIFDFSGTTGINEIQNSKFKIQIYPNPSDGNFTIDLGDFDGPVAVNIYDIVGNLVSQLNTHTQGKSQFSILNSQFPSGIYMVQITDGQHTATQKLVIK